MAAHDGSKRIIQRFDRSRGDEFKGVTISNWILTSQKIGQMRDADQWSNGSITFWEFIITASMIIRLKNYFGVAGKIGRLR